MGTIAEILGSELTAKKKARAIADALSSGALEPKAVMGSSAKLPNAELAIVIEALEGAARKKPDLVDDKLFGFLVEGLGNDAPRVQWEAARTISNVAANQIDNVEAAVDALLAKTTHDGTVVRWATAQALTAILRAGFTGKSLRDRLSKLAASEPDEGVRGVYAKALRARPR